MLSNFITRLFENNESPTSENYIVVQLNDKVIPVDKCTVYINPLAALLSEKNYGEISGGGTVKELPGEIVFCDIQIRLFDQINDIIIEDIIYCLENCGAPKGSKLIIEKINQEISFGTTEGIAIYIDSEKLQKESFKEYDVDFVQSEIIRLTQTAQKTDRYWEGESTTGLYFYGQSYEKMKGEITHFMNTYPLCQGARIAQIA
jgi:hypothetical protein